MAKKKLSEAATVKALAQSAARALKSLLAEKNLPEEVRTALETCSTALKKSWSQLEAESADAEESGANMADALYARMHSSATFNIDDLFSSGRISMAEYTGALDALTLGLSTFRTYLTQNAPGMFTRAPWEDCPDEEPVGDGGDMASEAAQSAAGEEFQSEMAPLMEAVVRRDGTIPVKIIQPGWGSSGYYPADVLERDGPKIFGKGLHMYWNHPTASEEAQRPERDLNDLAGVLASDARWVANAPTGPGLYADALVVEQYRDKVESLAPYIGLSIRALGQAQQGQAEGKSGPIITRLATGQSVDYVTAAGAGGEIVAMFEAARTIKPLSKKSTSTGDVDNPIEEAKRMDELKKLQEANAALQAQLDEAKVNNARAQEALITSQAKDLATTALAKLNNLPAITRTRLVESLAKVAPVKDGALDKAAFEAQIAEAVKAEVKYLVEATGLGGIRGMGASTFEEGGEGGDQKDIEESLIESFTTLGMSESSAKMAAKGRKE